MRQLPESVKTLWRIGGLVTGLVLGGVPAGIVVLGVLFADLPSGLWVLALVLLIGTVGACVWWADRRFENWQWQITPEWVEARYGVIGRNRVVVPRNRIQTVTTNSGPVDRMLDLETITMHTAGVGSPNLTIPHLSTETVAAIRREIGKGVDD